MISVISPPSIVQHVERQRARTCPRPACAGSWRPPAGGWRGSATQREARRTRSGRRSRPRPSSRRSCRGRRRARLGRHREAQVLVHQRLRAPARRRPRGPRCSVAPARARRALPSARPLAAPAGRCSFSPARARCSARLTDATLVSSSSAVSFARQPSTSRRISTARGRGGEVLDRDHERELDRLARDDLRVGLVVGGDARAARPGYGCSHGDLAARRRRARALLERVQARVGGDPVQPRAQRRAPRVGLARSATRAGTSPA